MSSRLLNKKCFLIILLTFFFFGTFFFLSHSQRSFDPETRERFPTMVFAGSRSWKLDIASTAPERTLGLGERESYPAGRGMLFLFPVPGQYGFWMKGMRFPIDIIFLSHGRIVSIERSFHPSDDRVIAPPAFVDQVLEVNAGEADDLSVGDRLWYWRSL